MSLDLHHCVTLHSMEKTIRIEIEFCSAKKNRAISALKRISNLSVAIPESIWVSMLCFWTKSVVLILPLVDYIHINILLGPTLSISLIFVHIQRFYHAWEYSALKPTKLEETLVSLSNAGQIPSKISLLAAMLKKFV